MSVRTGSNRTTFRAIPRRVDGDSRLLTIPLRHVVVVFLAGP